MYRYEPSGYDKHTSDVTMLDNADLGVRDILVIANGKAYNNAAYRDQRTQIFEVPPASSMLYHFDWNTWTEAPVNVVTYTTTVRIKFTKLL